MQESSKGDNLRNEWKKKSSIFKIMLWEKRRHFIRKDFEWILFFFEIFEQIWIIIH
jgi:hypothetical protein